MNIHSLVDRYEDSYSDPLRSAERFAEEGDASCWQSEDGRPIRAIRFGTAPCVLLSIGGVHGDEKGSINGVLRTMEIILSGEIDGFLENVSYVGVPSLNPDSAGFRRANARGVDVNRDFGRYGFLRSCGSEFSSKEAQAVREMIHRYRPAILLDHHDEFYSDDVFYTMDHGLSGYVQGMVERNVRMNVRRSGLCSEVYFYSTGKNKGMLVSYASAFCPSILIECGGFGKMHTIADISALETLNSLVKLEKAI